LLIATPKAYLA